MEYAPYIVLGFFVIVVSLIYLNGRTYRPPTRGDVIKLMERVIDGTAHWSEWADFMEIRYHELPEVDRIREHCKILDEFWRGEKGQTLSKEGIQKLKEILEDVRQGSV